MDKFYKLERYLKNKTAESFTMSFEEVEEILGFKLAMSAYTYTAYWNPSKTHTMANMILECGYKVTPNFYNDTLNFNKIKS